MVEAEELAIEVVELLDTLEDVGPVLWELVVLGGAYAWLVMDST